MWRRLILMPMVPALLELAWALLRLLGRALRGALAGRYRGPRRRRRERAGCGRTAGGPADSEPASDRRKPDWVRREVIRLAARAGSCRRVAEAFNAIHAGRASVGKTWVNEFCRRHAEAITAERRAMRGRAPHAVPVRGRWSLDLTSLPAGTRRCTVLGLIDQGSRAVLRLRVVARKCTWTLLGHLCLAIAEHGRPDAIRTDNEGMFGSRWWATGLRLAGIRRERIPPKCPWLNGRIERFFGTLKRVLRQLHVQPTAAALQGTLDEFAGFYNHVRVHQSLDGLTPAQAWRGVTQADLRRGAQGCWVWALDGVLEGKRSIDRALAASTAA